MTRAMVTPLLLLLPVALSSQQAPAEPPDPAAVSPFTLPRAQETLLPNGLRLVIVAQPRQPVLSLVLSVPAGTAYDPPGREGTAEMLAGLLTRGAGNRNAPEFASTIENAGGSLSAAADPDFLSIQADVTSGQAPLAFELVADMVTRPTLDSTEVEGLRRRSMASLAAGLEDASTLAARVFLLATYGQHPYARRPTPRTVEGIRRSDLAAFRQARIRPAGSTLLVTGDITLASARDLATRFFGRWQGARAAPLPALVPSPPRREILLIHQGGAQAASILVGGTTFVGPDTSYYAAAVLNQVLGEGRTSRLARTLGDQRGWSLSTASTFLRTARLGLFQATAQVPAVAADSALLEMRAALERLRSDLVPAQELQFARGLVSGTFALRIQTASQLATALAQVRMLGLPGSYIGGYRPRIEAVTAASLRALARRVFDPARLVTVVAGDAARLYPRLSALGPTQIFASDGRPLSPADVEPRTAPLAAKVELLVPRTDSLVITSNGQPVGLQVTQLARTGDSITYTERTAVGRELSQITRLTLDSLGRMRQLDQSGKVRGQDTRITLRYGGGRVRGEARVITPDGPRTITVDTAAAPEVLDDNALQALLPALPWALNTRWTFNVFASGENRIRALTLTVADIEQVEVPAGRFEAYRAYLEGGAQAVSFYVTAAAPHRLVKVTLEGSPIEFVAINH